MRSTAISLISTEASRSEKRKKCELILSKLERPAGAGLKDFCTNPHTIHYFPKWTPQRWATLPWLICLSDFSSFDLNLCGARGLVKPIAQIGGCIRLKLAYMLCGVPKGTKASILPYFSSCFIKQLYFLKRRLPALWVGWKQEMEGHRWTRCFWRSL